MGYTLREYMALSYCVPFSSLPIIFIILTLVNQRASAFIHRSILGVEREETNPKDDHTTSEDDKTKQSHEKKKLIKTFLYVPIADNNIQDRPPSSMCMRIVLDMACSVILGVFVAIIFQGLVLGYESVPANEECPDFKADCFPAGQPHQLASYTCEKNSKANFSSGVMRYDCFGFRFEKVAAKNVLETIGTCGGLMGFISMIVPLIYYLSQYKNCLFFSFSIIIIPLTIVAVMLLITRFTQFGLASISALGWIVFSLLLALTLVGWIWGFVQSCKSTKKNNYSPIRTCPFCYCHNGNCTDHCCNDSYCETGKCSCCCEFCNKQYSYYPLCLLKPCWSNADKTP